MRSGIVLLGILAGASAVWACATAVRMGAWLTAHGVKVNWFVYRATFPWHVQRYKNMTTELEGRPGPLFGQFQVAVGAALLLGLATVLARLLGGS